MSITDEQRAVMVERFADLEVAIAAIDGSFNKTMAAMWVLRDLR